MTLGRLNTSSRQNNLNIIRFLAATAVTFGHSFPLISGKEGNIAGLNLGYFGSVSVAIFFSLSGFLITQSYVQNPRWKAFLEARCLRIFPGLIFANLITVLLVGLFVKKQGFALFLDLNNLNYLISGTFFKFYPYSEAFPTLPFTAANGSLWTLPVEFRMYILILALGLLGLLKKPVILLGGFFVVALLTLFQVSIAGDYILPLLYGFSDFPAPYLNLAACFTMGILFFLFKDKILIHWPLGVFALIICLWLPDIPLKYLLAGYVAFVIGYHPGLYISSLNLKNDLSYAIYVLSFPVQQTLIFYGVKNPYVLFGITMLVVLPLSFFSWRYIEKPALRLKGRWSEKTFR